MLNLRFKKGDIIKARIYLADIKGQLYSFNREISGMAWVGYGEAANYKISEITKSILSELCR